MPHWSYNVILYSNMFLVVSLKFGQRKIRIRSVVDESSVLNNFFSYYPYINILQIYQNSSLYRESVCVCVSVMHYWEGKQ